MSTRGYNHNSCIICFKSPYKNPGVSLHRFPSCAKQRLVWLEACQLIEKDYLSSRKICSSHFDQNCFNPNYVRKCLKYGSIPTIFSQEDLDRLKLEREQTKESGSKVPIQHSRLTKESEHKNKLPKGRPRLKRELEDKSRISVEHSKLKRKSEDKSKKSVKILKVSSNEEEGTSDKESFNEEVGTSEKESSNEEEILFCPTTMVRYDNPLNPYSTQWVCRNCLSIMLSEDAVHKHLNISCEHKNNMPDFEFIKKYDDDDDDIENNGDDGGKEDDDKGNKEDDNNGNKKNDNKGNKEDDDKDNNEDCEEGNKNNDGNCTDNKEDDDVEDDSDDDYHEDDEDEDDDDYEDEDDEINDPYELMDLVKTV